MLDDSGYLDELSRQNNELVNLQRDLAKKNAELRQSETDLRCLNEALEQQIAETRQAKETIEELQRNLFYIDRRVRMEEMSASLAHELNQPLAGILSNAQASQLMLVTESPDLSELRAIQGDIAEDAKRAGDVIRTLRAFLKRDTHARQGVAMNTLIPDLIRFARLDAAMRDVVIETKFAEGLPIVTGDSIQIQEVLINLISNAVQTMAEHPETARLTISTARVADDAGVLVTVRDNGRGFTPEYLARSFEPCLTTKPDGLGLGLRICRSIIEAHGGRIWAENHPEGGAVVSFTLTTAEHAATGVQRK